MAELRTDPAEVTTLLLEWSAGDRSALDRLLPLVYDELRRLARRAMRREAPDHTLQTTALVHEAYLHLVDQSRARWQNRTQFYAIAAQAMRRILVDHARRRRAAKRGAGAPKVMLDEVPELAAHQHQEILMVDEALATLEGIDADLARLVELRYFAGLTREETAAVLGVSPATVGRDWVAAKAWLYRELGGHEEQAPPAART